MISNARHGAKIRRRFAAVQQSKRKRYECTKCGKTAIRRKTYAQWECRSCGTWFAGGAYSFQTETGVIARRMLSEQS